MLGVLKLDEECMTWLRTGGHIGPNRLRPGAKIHFFRTRVLEQRREHRWSDDLPAQCADPRAGWLCIFIVRNPVDRVISSMIHVARTVLSSSWPELHTVLAGGKKLAKRGRRQAAAGNFSLEVHVRALELMLAGSGPQLARGVGRWGADHVLPQTPWWLGSASPYPRSAFKLLPLDELADGLAAVDLEFRGGRLGLRELAQHVLRARHWVSANGGAVVGGDAAAVRPDTRSYASALCGQYAGFDAARHNDTCHLPGGAYAEMQATNASLWARVRCLFREDARVYGEVTCAQPWLLGRCGACAARCARALPGLGDGTSGLPRPSALHGSLQ
jgi:hypothetical protein